MLHGRGGTFLKSKMEISPTSASHVVLLCQKILHPFVDWNMEKEVSDLCTRKPKRHISTFHFSPWPLSSTPSEPQEFCENIFLKSQLHTANKKWGKSMNLFLHIGVENPMLTFFQKFLLPLFPVHFYRCFQDMCSGGTSKETCLDKRATEKTPGLFI